MPQDRAPLVPVLHNIATQLRIDSIRSTTAAGSGHPTTCCLGGRPGGRAVLRGDALRPGSTRSIALNDRFVLSKGHAAPLLYAAWAAVGFVKHDELLKLRELDIGPRRPPDAAAAVRRRRDRIARPGPARPASASALNARRIGSDYRTYVLHRRRRDGGRLGLGSGRSAAFHRLDNLVGITDVNRLGQSRPTMWQHDMEALARRWRAFGWHAIVIDGHNMDAILDALRRGARDTKGQPTMILAPHVQGLRHLVRRRTRKAGTARR